MENVKEFLDRCCKLAEEDHINSYTDILTEELKIREDELMDQILDYNTFQYSGLNHKDLSSAIGFARSRGWTSKSERKIEETN